LRAWAVRAARQSEEETLIARLDAEEAERKRKEEARKRFQDIEDFKIGLGRCTIRLGRNEQRVSLKAYGYAPGEVFEGMKQLARKHNGRFPAVQLTGLLAGRCVVFIELFPLNEHWKRPLYRKSREDFCNLLYKKTIHAGPLRFRYRRN